MGASNFSWSQFKHDLTVRKALDLLGSYYTVYPDKTFGPCPRCGRDYRSNSERTKRGCNILPARGGSPERWKCFACPEHESSGTSVDLVVAALGIGSPGDSRFFRWIGENVPGYESQAQKGAVLNVRRHEPATTHESEIEGSKPPPPASEVRDWLGQCASIISGVADHQKEARRYLANRYAAEVPGGEHDDVLKAIHAATFVRLVPPIQAARPSWWPLNKRRDHAFGTSCPLVFPVWSPFGELVTMQVRNLLDGDDKFYGSFPGMSGTVFACREGVRFLRGETTPETVFIAEGPTSVIYAALRARRTAADGSQPVPILGYHASARRAVERIRWPDGVRVMIGTDHTKPDGSPDTKGRQYRADIKQVLTAHPGRITVTDSFDWEGGSHDKA